MTNANEQRARGIDDSAKCLQSQESLMRSRAHRRARSAFAIVAQWSFLLVCFSGALAPARAAEPFIKPSQETTYFSEPVDAEGYLDVVAALNRHYGKGVTKENNGAIPFLQAVGVGEVPKKLRPELFKALDILPIADDVKLFTVYDLYPESDDPDRHDEAERQEGDSRAGPWKEADLPLAANWIEKNNRALDLIVEATKRPRMFVPNLSGRSLIESFSVMSSAHREAARLLVSRAMLHAGQGRHRAALDDLLVCHRLARQISQGPYMVDLLVAYANEAIANHGDVRLAQSGILTSAEIATYQTEMHKLSKFGDLKANIVNGEWLFGLNEMQLLLKGSLAYNNSMSSEMADIVYSMMPNYSLSASFARLAPQVVEWNEMVRTMRGRYVRSVDGYPYRDYAMQQRATKRIDEEVKSLDHWPSKGVVLFHLALGSAKTRGETLGALVASEMAPAIGAIMTAERRTMQSNDLRDIALALAAYKADHGNLPAQLADLAPKYLSSIPTDRFTGQPLKYQTNGTSEYLVYSFGGNALDNLGWQMWEQGAPDHCDDINIRCPPLAEQE